MVLSSLVPRHKFEIAQKTSADEGDVQHQVCTAHMLRNTEALIEKYQPLVARDADGSLKAIGLGSEQAAADFLAYGILLTRGSSSCLSCIVSLSSLTKDKLLVWFFSTFPFKDGEPGCPSSPSGSPFSLFSSDERLHPAGQRVPKPLSANAGAKFPEAAG